MRRPQRRYQLPPLVSHPLDDLWSVIVPIARTNLVVNPSFETNATNWAAIGGAIARSTTYQHHGAYSLAVTPVAFTDDGVQYGTAAALALTAGTAYAYSCKFRGQAGLKYELVMVSSLFVVLARKRFVATGRWQWVSGVYVEGSTATAYLVVRKDGQANTAVFYIDGVQVEACAAGEVYPTTYIDGDQQGLVPNQFPPAYIWNGTPHASTSSRSGLTRAGGRVVKFKDFGWFLTAIIGLGLAVPQHRITEYAALDGGNDDGTRKPTRQFTLVGQFAERTYGRLRENRGDLAALLDRDLIGSDQRLKLRYQAMRGCDLVGEEAEIVCKYAGGLEGNTDGHFGSSAPITFTNYLPVVLSPGEAGAALTVNQTVVNADRILRRTPGGNWQALSTGLGTVGALDVQTISFLQDGRVFLGGGFTAASGAPDDYGILYNPATNAFETMAGTGSLTGAVRDSDVGPDGTLYLGGQFLNADGIANADRIVAYNPTTDAFSALGTGASDQVNRVVVGPTGIVYAGGLITTDFGGVATTNGIGYWDGGAWNAMGGGIGTGGSVLALLAVGDRVYAGGSFVSLGGVANTQRMAYWDVGLATWVSQTATPPDSSVSTIVQLPNGTLLYGGLFDAFAGVAADKHAIWNGFSAIGLIGLSGSVNNQFVNPLTGTAWISGDFASVGSITIPEGFVQLIGTNYVAADVNLPDTPSIKDVRVTPGGDLYVAYNTDGAATAAGLTTINNIGTAKAYPTLVMNYPSIGTTRVYQIVNITTGRAIYLNLTMNFGETVTMRFDPDNLSFVSDFVGNVASTILPGSNEADFFLQPGDNIISFFTTGGTLTATLQWRPAYLSLDDH